MPASGRLFLAGVAFLALAPGIAPLARAQLAGTVEPFTFQSNAESWFLLDYSDDQLYLPDWDLAGDGVDPDISAQFLAEAPLEFYAIDTTSNGAFTGDYAAGGVDAIGCLVLIENSTAVNLGEMFFYSTTDEQYHIGPDYIPMGDGWNQAIFSLTADPWFIIEEGEYVQSALTPEILAGVEQIGFTFYPASADAIGTRVGLDSFALFASLVPPPLLASTEGGQPVISFERSRGLQYTVIGSPDLLDSAPVPGQVGLTGLGPYSFMPDLVAEPTQFFLLTLEDLLTPVPEVPAVSP